MITCPECGQTAPDDTQFCDRCGQGLLGAPPPPAGPKPLELPVRLGEYELFELLDHTSVENRYRAKLVGADGPERAYVVRERSIGAETEAEPAVASPTESENPAGPRAKTAELKLSQPAPVTAPSAGTADGAAPASVEQPAPAAVEPEPVLLVESASEQPGEAVEAVSAELTKPGESAENAGRDGGDGELKEDPVESEDLGEVFGRVMALSRTLEHPAFVRALDGFSRGGRAYLVYEDQELEALSRRFGGRLVGENQALALATQICQAVGYLNKRGLRMNDICPGSVALDRNGRARLTVLDYVSNDDELQSEPVLNDGYTAPEVYRGKAVDRRADVFSIGSLLYGWLTGERISAESWREEAGPIRFYPPHVIAPRLEQAIRRCLAFTPAERWPNADALKAELVNMSAQVTLRSAALTDVGRVREHNEDAVLVLDYLRSCEIEPAARGLYVVSDGMGGAEAGEVAAAIAVATIRDYVETRFSQEAAAAPAKLLQEALEEANRKILEYQAAHPEARGMGATAVAALVLPPQAAIAWVGDSRAYLQDATGLRQLTKDHSLVQRLVEIGQISADEAATHEHKNVITRSLGARRTGPAGVETTELRLKRGDRLLLCSDGLTAHVSDREISEILLKHDDPHAANRELVVAANAGGGTDNISVILVFAE